MYTIIPVLVSVVIPSWVGILVSQSAPVAGAERLGGARGARHRAARWGVQSSRLLCCVCGNSVGRSSDSVGRGIEPPGRCAGRRRRRRRPRKRTRRAGPTRRRSARRRRGPLRPPPHPRARMLVRVTCPCPLACGSPCVPARASFARRGRERFSFARKRQSERRSQLHVDSESAVA